MTNVIHIKSRENIQPQNMDKEVADHLDRCTQHLDTIAEYLLNNSDVVLAKSLKSMSIGIASVAWIMRSKC